MSGHTPTPWEVNRPGTAIVSSNEDKTICVFNEYAGWGVHNDLKNYEANSAYIVKAVNCHSGMVELLNDMESHMQNKNGLTMVAHAEEGQKFRARLKLAISEAGAA